MSAKTYDVIVIGAGISGLVCAAYLAKAGMRVLVVEQHDKSGGYCTSFRRKGFTFDAAAHSFGSYREGGVFRRIIRDLGVDKLVKFIRFNPSDIVIAPDFKLTFWNDTKDTIRDLVQLFPKEKDNIKNYFAYHYGLSTENKFQSVKLKDESFSTFLSSFFTDTTLINTVSFPVFCNSGIPPSLLNAFTGTKIFHDVMMDGGYYPDGGMQNLPIALECILRENNGTIAYKSLVKKIACRDTRVEGVILDNHEFYASKYVVSACDVTQTFKNLLGKGIVDDSLITKLENMIPSISTFILYFGIDRPFKELPEAGTSIWYLPCYDLNKIFNTITKCDLDNFGGGAFLLRVSPDKKTVTALCAAPFRPQQFWEQNKKKITERILNKIETIIPNFKNHIAYFGTATPHTLYRYTLNHKGANYGWAPLQSQFFDPDLRQKSFIRGLYLTGHWTSQVYGIHGVAYLGYSTANLILKNEESV